MFRAVVCCRSPHMAAGVGRPKYGHVPPGGHVGGSYLCPTVRSKSAALSRLSHANLHNQIFVVKTV